MAALLWRFLPDSHRPCTGCNVILITFDALRADHLGVYGYAKPTSPALDAFAARSTVFTRNVSQSGSTLSSVPSLHTSKLPNSDRLLESLVLRSSEDTLAELLDRSGYTTMAVVANIYARCRWGACQGIRFGDDEYQAPESATDTLARATAMLEAHGKPPFYLWVHFRVPHEPYDPGRETFEQFYRKRPGVPRFYAGPSADLPIQTQLQRLAREHHALKLAPERFYTGLQPAPLGLSDELRDQIVALYDGNIHQGDRAFGSLIAWLEHAGLLEQTVVVIAADHGEALGEGQHISHNRLDYTVIHTPLIVFVPGAKPRVVVGPTMNVDILPTVLGAVGLPIPQRIRGRDLRAQAPAMDRPVIAECNDNWKTVIRWPWKLTRRDGKLLLHDIVRDPGETVDLAATRPAEVGELDQMLTEISARTLANEPDRPDTDVIEKLRSLGYVNDEKGAPAP